MLFTEGNQFWKLRSKHGRDKLFESPELLWEAACEYFEWCESNPLQEAQAFAYQGEVQIKNVPKMRPFTIQGLCSYLSCNTAYFRNFKNQERIDAADFSSVIAQIEETLYNQKFTGAAAGFLNANIIARDLGLREGIDQKTTGDNTIRVIYEDEKINADNKTEAPSSGTATDS